ncbi:MAG TPA: helix-turn-helix domain-containing protein [Rhizomicrobium sp.]
MTKKTAVGSGILRGMGQALAFMDGTAEVSKYRVHIPHEIDVRRIRTKLDMTQAQFAQAFGFSVDTLRHWEQGRRVPDGAARAYLKVIDHAPKAVAKALRAA